MKANIYLNITLGSAVREDPDGAAVFIEVPVDLSITEGQWQISLQTEGEDVAIITADSPSRAILSYLSTYESVLGKLLADTTALPAPENGR